MTDKVYPVAKPNGTTTTNGSRNPTFPANKAQLYNATRPMYRPQPPPRRHRRSCCCSCCLWITFAIIIIILLAAIAGAVFWVLYRPHHPSFSVSSFHVSQFNFTSSRFNSRFNLTVSARNPNKKIVFLYDPIAVSITSGGIDVGDGSLPGFVHGTKNTTTLRAVVTNAGHSMDSTDVSRLRSDLRNRNSLPLKIQLETMVKVKIGGLKTKKVRIRVTCDRIRATVPTGRSATTVSTSNATCKVDVRIKIWKWTI